MNSAGNRSRTASADPERRVPTRARVPGPARRGARPAGLALVAALVSVVLAGCSFGPPPPDQSGAPPKLPSPSAAPSSPPDAVETAVEVIAKHLSTPWGIAFLPDGSGLVTERDSGKILKIGPDPATDGLDVKTLQTLSQAVAGGDGGLLGIAVSPKFAQDQTLYVYYSTATDNRVATLKIGGQPVPIVTGIPHGAADNGGPIAFGSDGYLYIGTGDAGNKATAQNKTSLAGKVLRATTAGKPVTGNQGNTLVYALGFRDVQGLAWDAGKRLYVTDTGADGWSELDTVTAGGNYGWPTVNGVGHNPKFTDPVAAWEQAEGGCSGVGVAEQLLVTACTAGARLYAMQLAKTGQIVGAPESVLQDKFGRLRSVAAAPDGSLWVTTSNKDGQGTPGPDDDQILRIVPAGSAGALT